ncbi:heterokaryon incompatibility protein-domain-containing protein [Xylogone sp. PMI_703]|nr:heterokaryon incompatibility protein-domain-containing protein [Xylogone sp. PMI_703]
MTCDCCLGINLKDLKSNSGYVHHQSCNDLVASTNTCDLCLVIVTVLKRSIHHLRRQSNPVKSISDIGQWGPVRLFAAGRKIDSQNVRYRERGPVREKLLSQSVAVVVGEPDALYYGPENAVLDMYADKGSFAESVGVAAPSATVQDEPASDFNIVRICNWLQQCDSSHLMCQPNFTISKTMDSPTRLLDVGFPGQWKVKLIEPNKQPVKYVALSYCWGSPHSGLFTTDDTLTDMMRGVPLDCLSKTIQDAIIVVRKLGLKYLWVDALCIIQENKMDWSRESKRMDLVYSNAYLTIGATSATAASEGFLSFRNCHKVTLDFRIDSNSKACGVVYYKEAIEISDAYLQHVLKSPLLQRGWVKQERILSHRTIDFSAKQMYWSCKTQVLSEDGQIDEECQGQSTDFINTLLALRQCQYASYNIEILLRQLFAAWADLISDYTSLQLTYESDRLPALAGIVGVAKQILSGRYLSGIWEINLADGLFWQPAQRPMERPHGFYVPSWSWASSTGRVDLAGHQPDRSRIKLISTAYNGEGVQVLRLRGRVHRCCVSSKKEPPPLPCRSDRKLKDPRVIIPSYAFALHAAVGPRVVGSKVSNSCRFDGQRGFETELYFLGLSCIGNEEPYEYLGLLLRRVDKDDDEILYERIGVGWCSDSFWYAICQSELSLI